MYRLSFDQYYSEGDFSTIYKVSPHRIIKLYNKFEKYNKEELDFLIRDEIRGSTLNYGLPVIKEVTVIYPICCRECDKFGEARGLLKRFIPFLVTEEECLEIVNRPDFPIDLRWDSDKSRQMRKDEEGRIYVIDTQTEKMIHLIRENIE